MGDEDLPHDVCRDATEMRVILPGHLNLVDELHVRFMYQRSSLERVIVSLTGELSD